jgi:WD40 repeat protein
LSWSADGDRIATYAGAGILTISPDGEYQKEFPLRTSSSHVLGYLSGHRLLITGPVVEVKGDERTAKHRQTAFSVIDAEAGKVLQNVPGCHPGRPPGYNAASDLAVSPDERFVAVICGSSETQIDIYSPVDWTKVATLDLRTGEKRDTLGPTGLAFSPNGKTLAVTDWSGRIRFFEAGSWTLSGLLPTYRDLPPFVGFDVLAFSPDGTMIAVGANLGGSRWTYPNGMFGSGVFTHEVPADPLRVYRIADASLVASLGLFPGGLHRFGLAWSPNGKYLAFQAIDGIRFWSPFQSDLSVLVARNGAIYGSLVFSRDGSQLAADFPDGVRVFDVVPPH